MEQPSIGSWEIIHRAEAVKAGHKTYFTGKPCVNGHIERRATHNSACAGCIREAHARAKKNDPDHYSRLKAEAYLRQRPHRSKAGKEYRLRNKEKIAERMKRWGRDNCQSIATKKLEYREKNREKVAVRAHIYRNNNKDRIRAYYEENKPRYFHRNRLRQARKIQATPPWANLDAIRLFYQEAAEKSRTTGIKHHVDHIMPLKGINSCGLHVEYNLQVIPWIENLKKSNKILSEIESGEAFACLLSA
jgi:AraC-like DNA-binding protein